MFVTKICLHVKTGVDDVFGRHRACGRADEGGMRALPAGGVSDESSGADAAGVVRCELRGPLEPLQSVPPVASPHDVQRDTWGSQVEEMMGRTAHWASHTSSTPVRVPPQHLGLRWVLGPTAPAEPVRLPHQRVASSRATRRWRVCLAREVAEHRGAVTSPQAASSQAGGRAAHGQLPLFLGRERLPSAPHNPTAVRLPPWSKHRVSSAASR